MSRSDVRDAMGDLLSEAQRCAQELRQERESLKSILAALRTGHEQLSHLLVGAAPASPPDAGSRAEQERAEAQRELADVRRRYAEIEQRLASCGTGSQGALERCLDLEQRLGKLAALFATSARLHETLDRAKLFDAAHEILGAIVGSEQTAIYERDREDVLRPVASQGLEGMSLPAIAIGEGRIGQTVQSGVADVGQGDPQGPRHERDLSACLPLRMGDEVIGAVAIYRLLPQKAGFTPEDYEVFEVLSFQLGMALGCSSLRSRARG